MFKPKTIQRDPVLSSGKHWPRFGTIALIGFLLIAPASAQNVNYYQQCMQRMQQRYDWCANQQRNNANGMRYCENDYKGGQRKCESYLQVNSAPPTPSVPSYSAPARPAQPPSGNANVDAINSIFSLFESVNELVKNEQESARQQREIERQDAERAARQEELNALLRKMEADRRASQPTPLPPAKSADDDFLDGGRLRKEYKAFDNNNSPASTTAAQTITIPSQTETRSNFSARSYGADSIDDPILVSNRDKSLERAMPRVLMRLAANTFELGRRINNIGASLSAFKTAIKTIDPFGEFYSAADSAVAKANPFKLEDDD